MSASISPSPATAFTYVDRHGSRVHLNYQTFVPPTPTAASRVPVVLVQGWTGRKDQWYGVPQRLAINRPVLVYDARGLSVDGPIPNRLMTDTSPYPDTRPRPDTPFDELVKLGLELSPTLSTFDMADDAVALAQHVYPKHNRLHWFGYSMGGAVLQCIALRHLDKVRSLSLTSTLGCNARQAVPEFMRAELPVPPASHIPETATETEAMQAATAMLMASDPRIMLSPHTIETDPSKLQELVGTMMSAPASLHTIAQHLNTSLAHNVLDQLPRSVDRSVPVVLMAGEHDCASLEHGTKTLKKTWPHARMVLWPNVGHVTMLEAQDELVRAVEENMDQADKEAGVQATS